MEIPTEVRKLSPKLEFSVNFECSENFGNFLKIKIESISKIICERYSSCE